ERDQHCLWRDHLADGDPARKTECCGCLPLSARDAGNRAAQDFGLIGGGIQREGKDRAVPGVAEEPPEPDGITLRAEGAEPVIDEEGLGEEGCSPEEIDVAVAQAAGERICGFPS